MVPERLDYSARGEDHRKAPGVLRPKPHGLPNEHSDKLVFFGRLAWEQYPSTRGPTWSLIIPPASLITSCQAGSTSQLRDALYDGINISLEINCRPVFGPDDTHSFADACIGRISHR